MKNVVSFLSVLLLISCAIPSIYGSDKDQAHIDEFERIRYSKDSDKMMKLNNLLNGLKKQGVDINIFWRESIDNPNVIQLLIDHGADINALLPADRAGSVLVVGDTPLMAAARLGNKAGIEKLLNLGANSSIRKSDKKTTALYIAAVERANTNTVKLLLPRADWDDVQNTLWHLQDFMGSARYAQRKELRDESDTLIIKMLKNWLLNMKKSKEIIRSSSYKDQYQHLDDIITKVYAAINEIKKPGGGYPRDPFDIIVNDPLGRQINKQPMKVNIEDLEAMLTEKVIKHPWKKERGQPTMVSVEDLEEERSLLFNTIFKEYQARENRREEQELEAMGYGVED